MYVYLYSVYIYIDIYDMCVFVLYTSIVFPKSIRSSFLSGNMLPRVQGMEATAAAG